MWRLDGKNVCLGQKYQHYASSLILISLIFFKILFQRLSSKIIVNHTRTTKSFLKIQNILKMNLKNHSIFLQLQEICIVTK